MTTTLPNTKMSEPIKSSMTPERMLERARNGEYANLSWRFPYGDEAHPGYMIIPLRASYHQMKWFIKEVEKFHGKVSREKEFSNQLVLCVGTLYEQENMDALLIGKIAHLVKFLRKHPANKTMPGYFKGKPCQLTLVHGPSGKLEAIHTDAGCEFVMINDELARVHVNPIDGDTYVSYFDGGWTLEMILEELKTE